MTDARFPERWLYDRRIVRLSDDAFRLFVVGLAWSASNRTDGHADDRDLPSVPGATTERILELEDAGLWSRQRSGWLMTVYDDTQTSSAQLAHLDEVRRKARDKKRRQRSASVPGDVPRDDARTGQARTGLSTYANANGENRSDKQPSEHGVPPTGGRQYSNGHLKVGRKPLDEHKRLAILELASAGLSYRQIAAQAGVGIGTVSRYLRASS